MNRKKGQVFSLDLVFGIVIFILLLLLFIGFFLFGDTFKRVQTHDYEMDYLFRNLEINMGQLNESMVFLQGSRVNETKLLVFENNYTNKSIDDLVIGNMSKTKGIGLDVAAYDVCLYFTQNTTIVNMSGRKYIGEVDEGSCDTVIAQGKNPCENYNEAISMFKPVLFDRGHPDTNKIIQMNLVVCKR